MLMAASSVGTQPVSALMGATASGGQNLPAPVRPASSATGTSSTSYNWAGYAQDAKKKSTYTGVTATFGVTTVNTSVPGTQYSSDWVGIGGFNKKTKDLVQAGVEEDNSNGTPFYQAWTEILPAASVPLSMTVSPGDTVTVTVRETALNQWTMTVADDTSSTSASRVVTYKSKGLSVEAIHERPCILDSCKSVNDLATLATTSNETFDPGQFTSSAPGPSATYSPLLVPATKATVYDIVMLANDGTTHIATPSRADSDSDGFTVADGSTAPPPPSS